MAESVVKEINILELELIQSVQTAVKAFEARNPGVVVDAVTYNYTSGGSIKYDVTLRKLNPTAVISS